jgi:predicted RNA binding protein YcfA (HicA-like mRNA interferase family)
MSSKLPVITGRQAAKVFAKVGYELQPGKGKGSHMKLVRRNPVGILIVPDHAPLKRGTLRALIRDADLSVDEFLELLK